MCSVIGCEENRVARWAWCSKHLDRYIKLRDKGIVLDLIRRPEGPNRTMTFAEVNRRIR